MTTTWEYWAWALLKLYQMSCSSVSEMWTQYVMVVIPCSHHCINVRWTIAFTTWFCAFGNGRYQSCSLETWNHDSSPGFLLELTCDSAVMIWCRWLPNSSGSCSSTFKACNENPIWSIQSLRFLRVDRYFCGITIVAVSRKAWGIKHPEIKSKEFSECPLLIPTLHYSSVVITCWCSYWMFIEIVWLCANVLH